MSDSSPSPSSKEPITDSPWFWSALFTAFGLAALLATGGRLGDRQSDIENKYLARSAVASGNVQIETADTGEKRAAKAIEYSTPDNLAIPLWPLEALLGAIAAGSLGMLLSRRFG